MEERDRNYVFRLEKEGMLDKVEPNLRQEVPELYAEIVAKRKLPVAIKKGSVILPTKTKFIEELQACRNISSEVNVLLNMNGAGITSPGFLKDDKFNKVHYHRWSKVLLLQN